MPAGDASKFVLAKLELDVSSLKKAEELLTKTYEGSVEAAEELNKLEEERAKQLEETLGYTKDLAKLKARTETFSAKRLKEEAKHQKQTKINEFQRWKARRKFESDLRGPGLLSRAGGVIRGSRVGKAASFAGGGIADIFGKLGGTVKLLNTAVQGIMRNPVWKLLAALLDMDSFYEFNRNVNEAAGGIDLIKGSLARGSGEFADMSRHIFDVSQALSDASTNIAFMVTQERRLEALRGFEAAGIKAREYFETIGKGVGDITIQTAALSRVMGRSVSEVSTMMADMVFQMGIAAADSGAVMSVLVADATNAGISQRRFIDAIQQSSASIGLYKFNLMSASRALSSMTKDSLLPASQTLKNFETLMTAFSQMDLSQLGASFQIAVKNPEFVKGLEEIKNAIARQLPKDIGVSIEQLERMNMQEFNNFLDTITDPKQKKEILQVYDAVSGLRSGLNGDIFALRDAIKRGALPIQTFELMANAITKQLFEGRDLRDLEKEQLDVLSTVLGISVDQLLSLQRSSRSNSEVLKDIQDMGSIEGLQKKALDDMFAVSQNMLKALENPQQAVEMIMVDLLRRIQSLMVELVNALFPYAVDLFALLTRVAAKGIDAMVQGIYHLLQLVEQIPGVKGGLADSFADDYAGSMFAFAQQVEQFGTKIQESVSKSYEMQIKASEGALNTELKKREETVKALDEQVKQQETALSQLTGLSAKEKEERQKKIDDLKKESEKLKSSIEGTRKAQSEAKEGYEKSLKGDALMRTAASASLQRTTEGLVNALKTGTVGSVYTAGESPAQMTKEEALSKIKRKSGGTSTADKIIEALVPPVKVHRVLKSDKSALEKASDLLGLLTPWGAFTSLIPGLADGGIERRPILTTFAEKGPEAAIPLVKVPEVFAKTIDLSEKGGASGSRGSIQIGQMVFQLPIASGNNPDAFANAVRKEIAKEFRGMLRDSRPV